MKPRRFSFVVKIILFQFIFLILHFLYDWLPNAVTTIISGIDESIYQHVKVGFFAYVILTLIEYLWLRSTLSQPKRFIHARIFSCILLPWLMIVYFLLGPLLFGQIHSIPLEILFANLCLLLTSASTVIIERHFEQVEPTRAVTAVLVVVFILALAQYIAFTYKLPWMDLFARPPGW